MSDSDENKDSENDDKEVPKSEEKKHTPPPINLPPPDRYDESSNDTAVRRTDPKAHRKAEKERKKKGIRSHPTDTYAKLKTPQGKGCCGCLVFLVILLFVVLLGGGAYFNWWAVSPYKDAGYETVQETGEAISVLSAPDVETIYLAKKIEYSATVTPKKIVFVAPEATISGVFEDKVTFKGGVLIIEDGTIFKGDLEIYAAKLDDRGSKLEGELTGRVISQ